MNQLNILGEVVNQIETIDFPHNGDQPHHRPSPNPLAIQHCKRVCKELENPVRDLAVDIESSRKRKRLMGKVAVVLKKDTLAKYEMRLQNAVQLLTLAHQAYTTSLLLRQPECIMATVTKALASTSDMSTALGNANAHTFEIGEEKSEHN
ncbi:hypothetical protein QBC32DRAFT_168094 [Pseudoneurospora amorphoporcata]|uniref:Uncharacterized protein n=1 Tax=Pseudoneurospora amorphoporcata TaxID=241081 RepID=A0AAN6SF17_9PEZI|nr:hypothetical protein QBC32DRAFT_168094 [Pseudoneurospora amorphoporcata]